MKLYNALTKSVEELELDRTKPVTIYSCGPTVYDHAHIGNLRTYIMEDTLRRTLKAAGFQIKVIMNITDVDDKTIRRSQEQFPELAKSDPKAALEKLTEKYEKLFFEDLARLGVDVSDIEVLRATEQIPSMQSLIEKIFAAGFAYVSEGSVYFDLAKYQAAGHQYGRLVNIDVSHQRARVDNDEYAKDEAQDFALWKASQAGEPAWKFELDGQSLPGRPGWHIECSAMSQNLGLPFDIHTGGIDLRFPHHENEIAQTQAGTNKPLTKVFLHGNHLVVDGKKMSKSLHNFYTLSDIMAKGLSPLAFRLLILQAHYSSELNFTWESLQAAQNALLNLYAWADLKHQAKTGLFVSEDGWINTVANDLNTPMALANIGNDMSLTPTQATLERYDALFGLGLADRPDITAEQKQLIAKREAARQAKEWVKSDELRDELAKQNLEINDTPQGPIWRRTAV